MIMITTRTAIIIMVLFSMIGPIGLMLLKYGSRNIRKGIMHPFKHYHLLLGLGILVFSFIFYSFMLRFGDVNVLYPLNALNYVWITLFSVKFLNEKMNTWKLAGILLIMASVVLIGIGS